MNYQSTPGGCQETQGFLFKHPCPQQAFGACMQCGKPICEMHRRHTDGGQLCVGCAKSYEKSTRSGRYGDPYGYRYGYFGSGYYDRGYWGHHHGSDSYDPNEFTEADGAALASEGVEGFESDPGES